MHLSRVSRLAPAFVSVLIGAMATGAQAQDLERPKLTLLRFNEDWSVLRDFPDEQRTDFWDPIKYVPLNDDGSIWASFGGSTRLRLENWWNFGFLPSSAGDDTFLLWRALFHADVHFGENVRIFAEGISALSTDRDLPGGRRTLDVNSIDLQQAFLDLSVDLGDTRLTLRGGRQEYLFGRQRLVSPLPWANALRKWDGVTGIYEAGGWTFTGFWSQFVPVQKYSFDTSDAQTPFYGIHATTPIDASFIQTFDAYFLGIARKDVRTVNGTTGTQDRYTIGGRIAGKIGESSFDYDLEGAYQFGRVGSGDVSAYMIGTQAGYRFGEWPTNPRLFVGFEMGSGDDSPGGNVETFDQLFPLGHAYFGIIDIIGRQNILAPNVGVQLTPLEKLTLGVTANFFWRQSDQDAVYNAGGGVVRPGSLGSSSEIGQEIDVVAKYKFDRHTTVELGYGHFFAGDFIQESGPSNDIDFLYVQLQYVF